MSKIKFILGWVRNNFFGWVIFNVILLFTFGLLEAGIRKNSFFVEITFMGLLLGSSIGSMQWLWLIKKNLPIQAFWWILVTTLSWGFSALLFSNWPAITHMHSYSTEAVLSIIGIIIGTSQAIVMHSSIRNSILWIVASVLGMLALGWSMYGIVLAPIVFKTELLNTFHSLFVSIPAKIFYFPFIWMILPFLGAITTALPTGFVLFIELKSKNISIFNERTFETPSTTD